MENEALQQKIQQLRNELSGHKALEIETDKMI